MINILQNSAGYTLFQLLVTFVNKSRCCVFEKVRPTHRPSRWIFRKLISSKNKDISWYWSPFIYFVTEEEIGRKSGNRTENSNTEQTHKNCNMINSFLVLFLARVGGRDEYSITDPVVNQIHREFCWTGTIHWFLKTAAICYTWGYVASIMNMKQLKYQVFDDFHISCRTNPPPRTQTKKRMSLTSSREITLKRRVKW